MYDKIGIQQGWQCPLCKRIYAPFVTECFYCPRSGEKMMTTTTTDTGAQRNADRVYHEMPSITPCETDPLIYTT